MSGRVITTKGQWRSYNQARAFVRKLGLKSHDEWRRYAAGKNRKLGRRPADIPANVSGRIKGEIPDRPGIGRIKFHITERYMLVLTLQLIHNLIDGDAHWAHAAAAHHDIFMLCNRLLQLFLGGDMGEIGIQHCRAFRGM